MYRLSATDLLAKLNTGEVSSVDIVEALTARTEQVNPKLNAFSYRLHARALKDAAASDEVRAKGQVLGPLHGLPVSIKDNLDIRGLDSTMGLASRRNQPAKSDALVVAALRDAGAVILGKTNVPQLLLAQETENALFGVTNNPWDVSRVPGGSSGGEAAAVAAGMSPLGFGTDIGGSIRIPCHFCGVTGIKMTLDRWSNRGSNGAVPGQELVRSQVGPIARRVDDLVLALSALDPIAMARRDPAVPPLPFGDPREVDLSSLRIGFFEDDGFLSPAPAMARAVTEARQVLADRGATLVPYHPEHQADVLFTWLAGLAADGGATFERQLQGEQISPQLASSLRITRLPNAARQAIALAMDQMDEHRVARLLRSLGKKPVHAFWDLVARRTELRRAEIDAWNRVEIEALLCPAHVVPAMAHQTSGDFVPSLAVQFRWTLLNFPAGVVPVTRVRESETHLPARGDRIERKVAAVCEGSAGLPVGVQLVARPYDERTLLATMLAVESGVRDNDDFPHTPVTP
jgi:fatty acid amide hydrolase